MRKRRTPPPHQSRQRPELGVQLLNSHAASTRHLLERVLLQEGWNLERYSLRREALVVEVQQELGHRPCLLSPCSTHRHPHPTLTLRQTRASAEVHSRGVHCIHCIVIVNEYLDIIEVPPMLKHHLHILYGPQLHIQHHIHLPRIRLLQQLRKRYITMSASICLLLDRHLAYPSRTKKHPIEEFNANEEGRTPVENSEGSGGPTGNPVQLTFTDPVHVSRVPLHCSVVNHRKPMPPGVTSPLPVWTDPLNADGGPLLRSTLSWTSKKD
jgi:hypothetical protein